MAGQKGKDFEQKYVHSVYEEIADHFDATRYKVGSFKTKMNPIQPWPVVERFLNTRITGSLGLDVGCGNGKYISINRDVFILGCDMCYKLLQKALFHKRSTGNRNEVLQCDALSLPFVDCKFDFVICIAVIHHLSTRERRILAISQLIRMLKSGGEGLIFVWAFEQHGKRKYDEQDAQVSWKIAQTQTQNKTTSLHKSEDGNKPTLATTDNCNESTVYRFYHFFVKGELDELVLEASKLSSSTKETNFSVDIVESGYDRDNCSGSS